MPRYFLKGGTIIWPHLLSSMAARACLSLAETYGPTAGEYPGEQIEADLEAVRCVILKFVNENRMLKTDLPLSIWKEKETKVIKDHSRLFQASGKSSHTMSEYEKNRF